MPKCKKIYPNFISILPPEWHKLNIYSALLTKFYWNYATKTVRVCVTATSPTTFTPDVNRKSNKQIHFGSKAMGSLYELLCHHSLSSVDPLLDELLSYLLTRFSSHIFDYIVCEDSDDDPYCSESNISAFYSDDSTYFSWKFENDVCAIPISTYHQAAQTLKQYTNVWALPTPTRAFLNL